MLSKTLTAIKSLEHKIRERFPNATMSIDLATEKTGIEYLDIEDEGHHVAVQWKESVGFGISCSPEHFYGEGADEVYKDEEAAYSRIVCLLLSRTYTSPPESVRIAELRRERRISQEALAKLLEVNQASVSKLERRKDVLISSIREVIRSMGGELSIVAKFPDGMERTLEFDDVQTSTKRRKQTKAATHK